MASLAEIRAKLAAMESKGSNQWHEILHRGLYNDSELYAE